MAQKSSDALDQWKNLWKDDIDNLPDNQKDVLKRMYQATWKELNSNATKRLIDEQPQDQSDTTEPQGATRIERPDGRKDDIQNNGDEKIHSETIGGDKSPTVGT
jgi:hypothetical protein